MEKTLSQLLCERVTEFAQSRQAVGMIDAAIESMFRSVISDCLGRYGDMEKQVKEAVKAALPGNISGLFELKRYNAIIAESLKRQWESAGLEEDMKARLGELLNHTLKEHDFPSVILLSDFMEAFVEMHRERAFEKGWEAPRVIYKTNEGTLNYCSLYFDRNPEESTTYGTRSEYELENRIAFTTDGEGVFRTKDQWGHDTEYPLGRVFSAVLEGRPASKEIRPIGFERMVQALYYGMSRIAIDCDPEETCYPCND